MVDGQEPSRKVVRRPQSFGARTRERRWDVFRTAFPEVEQMPVLTSGNDRGVAARSRKAGDCCGTGRGLLESSPGTSAGTPTSCGGGRGRSTGLISLHAFRPGPTANARG